MGRGRAAAAGTRRLPAPAGPARGLAGGEPRTGDRRRTRRLPGAPRRHGLHPQPALSMGRLPRAPGAVGALPGPLPGALRRRGRHGASLPRGHRPGPAGPDRRPRAGGARPVAVPGESARGMRPGVRVARGPGRDHAGAPPGADRPGPSPGRDPAGPLACPPSRRRGPGPGGPLGAHEGESRCPAGRPGRLHGQPGRPGAGALRLQPARLGGPGARGRTVAPLCRALRLRGGRGGRRRPADRHDPRLATPARRPTAPRGAPPGGPGRDHRRMDRPGAAPGAGLAGRPAGR